MKTIKTPSVKKMNAATKLYMAGFGPKEVAERTGLTPDQVSRQVNDLGVSHNYNKAVCPETIETIKKEYKNGATVSALAKKYGTTATTIRSYCDIKPVLTDSYEVKVFASGVRWYRNGVRVKAPEFA